jgi:hypothetical protein
VNPFRLHPGSTGDGLNLPDQHGPPRPDVGGDHRGAVVVERLLDVVRHEFTVEGHELDVVSSDPSWLDVDIPVVDAETGRSLGFEDDPEGWARRLPDAYRSGDLVAVIVEAGTPVQAAAAWAQPV